MFQSLFKSCYKIAFGFSSFLRICFSLSQSLSSGPKFFFAEVNRKMIVTEWPNVKRPRVSHSIIPIKNVASTAYLSFITRTHWPVKPCSSMHSCFNVITCHDCIQVTVIIRLWRYITLITGLHSRSRVVAGFIHQSRWGESWQGKQHSLRRE